MSHLFKIEGRAVFPNPETLLIPIFAEIWDRDTSESKTLAMQEFAYMEFMTSMLKSNPYKDYPESKKHELISKDTMPEGWQPDELVQTGKAKIIEFQEEGSITYSYWMANKVAVEKIIDFFLDFDMNERNMKTMVPIYKPKDITSSVMDAEKTMATIINLKTKVDEELFESTKTRGDKIISPFATLDT